MHRLSEQRPGDHVGSVVEFDRGGADALTSYFGDGAAGRVVEDEGDGGWTEIEVCGQVLETCPVGAMASHF